AGFDMHAGGAEDVSGRRETHAQGAERERRAEWLRLKILQRAFGFFSGIERLGGVVFGVVVAVGAARVLLLQMATVRQQNPGQRVGAVGTEHWSAKTLANQAR